MTGEYRGSGPKPDPQSSGHADSRRSSKSLADNRNAIEILDEFPEYG